MPIHPTLGNTALMERKHGEVIQRGEARMPRPNETCDMSCAFAFCCANYNENGRCQGFQLLSNGKLERHIREEILPDFTEGDRLSIERYIQMIQQTRSPEILNDLVPVVYRSLKPPEKKEKRFTLRGFEKYEIDINGNLKVPDPPPKPPKIPDPEPIHMILLRHNMEKKGDEKEK